MNRRPARLLGAIATAVAALIVCGVSLAEVAAAQTTTAPATTSPPTTSSAPATASTAPAGTSSPPAPTATEAPATTTGNTDSGDDTPWALIAVAVLLVAAIIGGLVVWSRRRGQRQQATLDWRRRAASAASETSATARLLAGGTPANAAIDQQIRGTSRTFEDLLRTAPDDATRAAAQDALGAVRELGIALDADASARDAQPPFPAAQVAAAAAGLRSAASEADRTLREVSNRLADG